MHAAAAAVDLRQNLWRAMMTDGLAEPVNPWLAGWLSKHIDRKTCWQQKAGFWSSKVLYDLARGFELMQLGLRNAKEEEDTFAATKRFQICIELGQHNHLDERSSNASKRAYYTWVGLLQNSFSLSTSSSSCFARNMINDSV
jgi:hypothetical protein